MLLPLLLACTGRPAVPPPKPDIVLVIVDTLRADHLGIYGHERPTTPVIDKLAQAGTWFSRAYASSGWTLPSMATLFTGQHPHQHRAGRAPFQETQFGRIALDTVTVAEAMGAVGYATAAIVNNTFMAPDFELRQGFDLYDYKGATNKEHRTATETVQTGLAWLSTQDKPAYLVLHVMEPHLDYDAPAPFKGVFSGQGKAEVPFDLKELVNMLAFSAKPPDAAAQEYVRARYDEEILVVDQAMDTLVSGLEEQGRWDRTVLVITSDHGEEFWEHGGYEHGHTLLGELTRVPLVLAGAVPNHGRVDAVVEHVDLVQGLLAITGADRPSDSSGANLFGIADGSVVESPAVALSENILYGAPRLSLVDQTARVEIDVEAGSATVWAVDPDGIERRRMRGPKGALEAKRLQGLLESVRGGLLPVDVGTPLSISNWDMFSQLKSLGYVGDAQQPESPEAAPSSEPASDEATTATSPPLDE